jgi:hypothetical protein
MCEGNPGSLGDRNRFIDLCAKGGQIELPVGRPGLKGSGVTPARINTCSLAIRRSGCGSLPTHAGEPCELATGALGVGAVCASGSQCQSGSCVHGGATCGTCAAALLAGAPCDDHDAGSTCSDGVVCLAVPARLACAAIKIEPEHQVCGTDDLRCAPGLYCDQVCRKPVAVGGACTTDAACGPGLRCDPTLNLCSAALAEGQDCTSRTCPSSLYCMPDTHRCVRLKYHAAGEVCDNGANLCRVGSCYFNSATGACPEVLADGALCSEANGSSVCGPFAHCSSGICQTDYNCQ